MNHKKLWKFCLAVLLGCTSILNVYDMQIRAANKSDQETIEEYQTTLTGPQDVAAPASRGALPNASQMKYYEEGLSAFIHFGPNTFTGNEWGHGSPEEIAAFNPTELDTDQWVKALKESGFKKVIVTAKHHDGFQLWPSQYSERNVKNSPFGLASEDQGDILARLSASCTKFEMDMGLYLSPWDMGEPSYGEHVKIYRNDGECIMEINADGSVAYLKEGVNVGYAFQGKVEVIKEDENGNSLDPNGDYNELYMNQLMEVLGNDKYGRNGKFSEVWMDGAKNDARYQQYDLNAWWDLCRKQEPGVLIFNNIGNEVRWVGNESGFSYDPIWAQVSSTKMWNDYNLGINAKPEEDYPSQLKIISKDGKTGWAYTNSYEDGNYLTKGDPNGDIWSMPEADYSIIGDWFWKKKAPQTGKAMCENYFQSVGNATPMLLNTPPNQKGLLEDSYVKSMNDFHDIITNTFKENLTENAKVVASSTYKNSAKYEANNVVNEDYNQYWAAADDQKTGTITAYLNGTKQFDLIDIKEYIPLGQNISSYEVEVRVNGKWQTFGKTSGTKKSKQTIGYRSILRDNTVNADAIRLTIKNSHASPKISSIGAYKMDERIEFTKGTTIIPEGLSLVEAHSAVTTGTWDKNDKDTARPNSMITQDGNATATYTFTGSKFYLSSRYSPNFGGMKVTIDNKEPIVVSLNKPTSSISDLVYESDTLELKEHTVTLQPVTENGKLCMASDGLFYLNNKDAGLFEIENPVISVEEAKTATLVVNRLGGSKGEASVKVTTEPGTAVHGRHYQSVNTVLTFKDGETRKEVALPTIDNDETSGMTYFYAVINEATNALLGFRTKATIQIDDNEVDLSALQTAIDEAKNKNQNNYTQSVWDRLQSLLKDAETFITRSDLSASVVANYLTEFQAQLKTIREIGTYVQLDTKTPVLFEAEDGELGNGAVFYDKNSHANFAGLSGRGMVGDLMNEGSLTVWFDAPKAGTYSMKLQVYSGAVNRVHFTNGKTGAQAIEGTINVPHNGSGGSIKTVTADMDVPTAGMQQITFKQKDSGVVDHPNMDAITFTYKNIDVFEVSVTPASAKMMVGDTKKFTAKVLPDNASNKTVQWSVSDTDIATCDDQGNLSAKKNGTIRVIAKADGVTGSATVSITSNTSALKEKIAEAEKIQGGRYTLKSYQQLQNALMDAQDLVKKVDVDQADLDEALRVLTSAIEQLVIRQDKVILNDTLNTANSISKDTIDGLHAKVKKIFLEARAYAQSVMNDEKASAEEINTANDRLTKAIQMINFKVDYTALDTAIQQGQKIMEDIGSYEEASRKQFIEAFESAKHIREDEMSIQADIDLATTALNKAIQELVLHTDTSVVKSILKSAIDKAKLVDKTHVVPAVVKLLEKAIANAENVYNTPNASNADYLTAWMELANAMHYLEFKADKASLAAFIKECEAIQLENYQGGVAEFEAALQTAKEALAKENILQDTLDKVYQGLEAAKNALVLKDHVDKTLLEEMIKLITTSVKDGSLYKKDSHWTAFEQALKEAQRVVDNPEATQLEVNNAMHTLASAYENLRLLPNEEQLKHLNTFVKKANGIRRNLYTKTQLEEIDAVMAETQAMLLDFDSKKYAVLEKKMADITTMINQVEDHQVVKPNSPDTSDSSSLARITFMMFVSGALLYSFKKKKEQR